MSTPGMQLCILWDPHFLGLQGVPPWALPQQDVVSRRSLSLVAAESAWAQPEQGGVMWPLLFHLLLTSCVRGDMGCLPGVPTHELLESHKCCPLKPPGPGNKCLCPQTPSPG